ncbi:MAG TPA: hypothetical protein VJY15_01000 [Candidatus Acidoferrum sp.]|nr:hypothetical protein [Candidatus Acidoferrum sp.]
MARHLNLTDCQPKQKKPEMGWEVSCAEAMAKAAKDGGAVKNEALVS